MTLPELRWALRNLDAAALMLPTGGGSSVSLDIHDATDEELAAIEQAIRERGDEPRRRVNSCWEGSPRRLRVYETVSNFHPSRAPRVQITAFGRHREPTLAELVGGEAGVI